MMKLNISILAGLFAIIAWNMTSVEAVQTLAVTNTQNQAPDSDDNVGQLVRSRVGGLLPRQDPLAAATKRLKDAESEQDEKDAIFAIREELEKQYDQFLEANEKQIEDLQQRLNNLKDQLERRRKAKSKMVDLELERVINESEGLIWPSRSRRRPGFGRGSGFAVPSGLPPGVYESSWRAAPAADPFAGPPETTRPSRPTKPGGRGVR